MTEDAGVIVAALTPRGKKGDLDFGAAFEMIDFLCASRVRGIALFTATGEYPAYTVDERTRLVYLAAKRSRVPVFAGVGAISLDDSVTLAREAQHAGAAGVFLPPPHFFPYSQEELHEFYLQFAAQIRADSKIWIANTPAVTSPIAEETALSLLATGRFAGIEDPGADAELYAAMPVAYLTSDDASLVRARKSGARGVVSPAACAVPELLVALDCALSKSDEAATVRRDAQLREFLAWAGEFPHPLLMKTAAGLRGMKPGAPTIPLSAARQRRLDEFRRWFEGWLPSMKQ
ncbi:MAG: dihydrodipicolinate synthetase [Candidatus Solibacter sp.]|jgi:4-hydroxy-tetrahydrodipicolinate synthase|nr:dihydrodipicolinate synthetase [Candidatus Solibacter sp.]